MNSYPPPCDLAELFDFLDDVVAWVKDREGRYLWVNRTFLINYCIEHPAAGGEPHLDLVLGKTDYELSPAFLADQFRLDDEQVLAGHRILNRIERVSGGLGGAGWNVTNKIPVFGADGTITGAAGVSRPLNLPGPDRAAWFSPVLAFFRDHYPQPITNQDLAQVAHLSVRAFERRFLATFQLTPQKYLRRLRLRVASRALIYTDRTLADVGLACGFADQSHFTREFHRHFGRTPRDYREHYRAVAVSGTNSAGPAL